MTDDGFERVKMARVTFCVGSISQDTNIVRNTRGNIIYLYNTALKNIRAPSLKCGKNDGELNDGLSHSVS